MIRDAVERVRDVLPSDGAAFTANRDAREVVALNLLIAIQEAIDLAAHWIADAGLVVPGTHRELFTRLADRGVIPADLGSRLAAASGMRNIIAHQYGTVDWSRVHAAASSGLVDLEALCNEMARQTHGGGS